MKVGIRADQRNIVNGIREVAVNVISPHAVRLAIEVVSERAECIEDFPSHLPAFFVESDDPVVLPLVTDEAHLHVEGAPLVFVCEGSFLLADARLAFTILRPNVVFALLCSRSDAVVASMPDECEHDSN